MQKYIYTFTLILFFCLLFSCQKDEIDIAAHTLIIYMAADNDLSEDAVNNLQKIKEGYRNTGAKLLVFIDTAKEEPELLEINEKGTTLLKKYPEFNSVSAEGIKNVLNDAISLYPSESYGLVLWSHGTSWLPAGVRLKSPKAFGDDKGKQLNITDLADALPVKFDFILFDACLMGAVEVAYELKEKTNYILAPSTETIADGFPYDIIVPELLSAKPDLKKTAKLYFDFYNSQYAEYRSATVSVINTQELNALSEEMKKLIQSEGFHFQSFNRSAVQRLDTYSEQYHFDLLDFIEKSFISDKTAFKAQLNRTILYKAHTPRFIEMYEIRTYCGLSCYIPHFQCNDLNTYYSTLKWSVETGISEYLKAP